MTKALENNFQEGDAYENLQFYYHSDHLGSSSYITNLDGEVVQHIEYVPFGEVFIEERNKVWNTPIIGILLKIYKAMRSNLLIIFILSFIALNGCNNDSRILKNNENIGNEINVIDTTNIIPQLKTILMEYIKIYPQFNNFVLDEDVLLYKRNKYMMNNDYSVYLLGPTSMMRYGEYYGPKRLYPSSCLKNC